MNTPTVTAARIAKDDSRYVMFSNGTRVQLSQQQLAVMSLAHRDPRGFVPTESLYAPVFNATGPATPSQRASMSRLVRRLRERGLTVKLPGAAVKLYPLGVAIAEFVEQQDRENSERGSLPMVGKS